MHWCLLCNWPTAAPQGHSHVLTVRIAVRGLIWMIRTRTTSWAGCGRGSCNENSARTGFCLRMRSSRRWRSCHDSSKGRTSGAYPQESMRTDIYLIPGPGRPSALSALAPRGTVMFNNHVRKHKSNFFVHEHELHKFPFMFDNHVVEHEMIGYRSCSRTCHVREHESRVGVGAPSGRFLGVPIATNVPVPPWRLMRS